MQYRLIKCEQTTHTSACYGILRQHTKPWNDETIARIIFHLLFTRWAADCLAMMLLAEVTRLSPIAYRLLPALVSTLVGRCKLCVLITGMGGAVQKRWRSTFAGKFKGVVMLCCINKFHFGKYNFNFIFSCLFLSFVGLIFSVTN